METTTEIVEPAILTAGTYFWRPASAAYSRRSNEAHRQQEVADFFATIGLNVTRCASAVIGESDSLRAVFSYRESCTHVYKSLEITRNGKKYNITALRKLYK